MGCAYPGTKCEGAPAPGKTVPGCTERDFKGLYEGERAFYRTQSVKVLHRRLLLPVP